MAFLRTSLALCLLFSFSAKTAGAQPTETERRVEQPLRQAIDTSQSAQKTVDQWRGDRERLTARYELLEQEIKQLKERNDELQTAVDATRERLAQKKQQLGEIERITGEITPFLEELYTKLAVAQQQGPPFLLQERQDRLEKLQVLINDPGVSVGEKYRRLMEGLMVEAEYGTTTEVYQDHIDLQGQPTLVDVFRLGRLNLFYLTLDQEHCGFYNEAERTWQPLDESFLRPLKSAVAMAAKRQPVEMVSLPLGRMVQP
nr:DUF3450 domain-containing protein [uncultured Desulfobulbus sp.]